MFIEWFKDRFNIVYRADELEILPPIPKGIESQKFYSDKVITRIAKNFGAISSKIAFPVSEDETKETIENGDKYNMYGRFKYYVEAPDMTIHRCIEQILKECEIIK